MMPRFRPKKVRQAQAIERSPRAGNNQRKAGETPSTSTAPETEIRTSRPAAAGKPDRDRAARPVLRVGRALVVVPSVRPSYKAWRRLGFALGETFEFKGCEAFDLALAGCSVRFLALPRRPVPNLLMTSITEMLEKGAGLLGWTWACQCVYQSRETLEERTGIEFSLAEPGRKCVVVPRKLSPGATTLLEPLVHEELPPHPNRVTQVDHLVITVSDVDAAADAYERGFGLHARRTTIRDRRYAFLKAGSLGAAVVEIVGPVEPEAGPVKGHGWGLAFRTADLDATLAYLRRSGVSISNPHEAVQGGRIASLSMQIGGVAIAFLGD